MNRIVSALSCIVLAALLSACSGTYKYTIDFDRNYPLRVAVLPFYQVDASGAFVQDNGSILIDALPAFSDAEKEPPPEFLRKLVQSEIIGTAIDPITPIIVDRNLSHSGLTKPRSLDLDIERIIKMPPKELCTRIFSCDAVLYGKVTNWDRSYYGIQAVSTVGFELKLVSAKSGKVLFETIAKDSDGRGILKGPTGFSDLVVAPLSGLDNSVITDLAKRVVQKAVEPLKMPTKEQLEERSPPSIFAATHDAFSGTLKRNQTLTALVFATSAATATLSIGNAVKDIPLIERSPGHYVGEYHPAATDSFVNAPVKIVLIDKLGRRASQIIGRGEITLQ